MATTRERCKRNHLLTDKTIRWTTVNGRQYLKCRTCEAEQFRTKYRTNPEFRADKRSYNLIYYKTKVAPKHAI